MTLNDKSERYCRVCGLDKGEEEVRTKSGRATFNICDCCGVEFGYGDTTIDNVKDIRKHWIYNTIIKDNYQFFYKTDLQNNTRIALKEKIIFNKLNDDEKKIFLKIIETNIENTLASFFSIIDEWGGGYFNDGKDNDGHFELYYVSDEEGKYKYRVDEDTLALFLERMEEQQKKPNPVLPWTTIKDSK